MVFGLVVDTLPSIVRLLVAVKFPVIVVLGELADSEERGVDEGLGVLEISTLFAVVAAEVGTLDEATGLSTPVNC